MWQRYVVVSSEVISHIFTVQSEKFCDIWSQYIHLPVIIRKLVGVTWLITLEWGNRPWVLGIYEVVDLERGGRLV
jgi:hypothetical protein